MASIVQHFHELPLIKEIMAQAERQTRRTIIEEVIEERFGALPKVGRDTLHWLMEKDRLEGVRQFANRCPTLDSFLDYLDQQAASAAAQPPRRKRYERRKW